jgi:hypothetical protein
MAVHHRIGHSATSSGWRKTVSEKLAAKVDESPVPLRAKQVRTLLGLYFLASSIKYVVKSLRGAGR